MPEVQAVPAGMVQVSLNGVLAKMPASLKSRVKSGAKNTQLSFPLGRVLPQLGHGRVQVTFGELRQAAPAGVIAGSADQDKSLVDLPLHELLPQIPPDQLPRRASQKKVEVPDDVAPVFNTGEMSSVRLAAKEKPKPSPGPPVALPSPVPTAHAPAAPMPTPRLPAAAPAAPARAPSQAAPAPAAPIPLKHADFGRPSAPAPSAPSSPYRPVTPSHPAPAAVPSPYRPAATAMPPPKASPGAGLAPSPTVGSLAVPVSPFLDSWPDAIRNALAPHVQAHDLQLQLPMADVEKGLKAGKVVFPWRVLRTFLKPAVSVAASPAADDLPVNLSLKVLAPLFLAQHKPASPQKKVVIAADIPDVFGAGRGAVAPPAPPAAAPMAPAAAPHPPPAAIPVAAPAAAAPPMRPLSAPAPQDVGEILGQPGRKQWSPADVTQRISALPGVAGALVALQDGLLVAGHLPPGLNGETIAAFLPQLYTRMTQYCKELKFGEPHKLTFVIEDVPLKMYRGAGIYFAILGRSGENLPDAHLDVIAAHLSSQAK